jgi:hypothetical protein
MELKAKIIRILDAESGVNEKGPWHKRSVLIKTLGKYPREVCVCFWKSKINFDLYATDDVVLVKLDLQSHFHNNKWYTTPWGWYMEKVDGADITRLNNAGQEKENDEDLPFI